MYDSLRAVTDVVGDHLLRSTRRIAPGCEAGTAERLVSNLSETEKVIFSLIESGAVRRNQLDEVAGALQATRLLKKFRYGGLADERRKAALDGFYNRNLKAMQVPVESFLRDRLLLRMRALLSGVLPEPCTERCKRVVITDRCGSNSFTAYTWLPGSEPFWETRFGTGAVEEGRNLPFLRRWELTDGSIPVFDAIRRGDLYRILRELPTESASRASAVRKTMVDDRLITIEPATNCFIQHGVRRMVYESIHLGRLRWTAMDVMHLEDAQLINRRYALTGSRDSTVATIDMKDASDLILYCDVLRVMPPWLTPWLTAGRSTHCMVGGHGRQELGMFAGMGNACTFVVETLMFWAAAQAMMDLNGLSLKVCSVYGDDVVIDTSAVPYVLEAFEALGWVVNRTKSFWGSNPFRESCGMWAWNGHCITPARFDGYDLTAPQGRSGYREAIANLLSSRSGLALLCADRLMKRAGPYVPVSDLDIPGSDVVFDKYGMWSNNYSRIRTRINRDTQTWEAKVVQTEPATSTVPADRVGYLYGSLAGSIRTSYKEFREGGLRRTLPVVSYAIPHRVKAKVRWLACTPSWGQHSHLQGLEKRSGPIKR